MSAQVIAMILAPLLGLFIVSIGNGFLSSLTTLRLDTAGASETVIGLVSSAYFIGLTLGAVFHDRLISRIGHIRAYSSFASLITVSVLLQGMYFDVWFWFALRLLYGWAAIGIFLVIESWLLLASDQKMRGRILALYMIALYGSGMLGQIALGTVGAWGESAPYMAAAILASLSVLPIVILPKVTPVVERVEALKPLDLLRMTPSGVIGCFGSGIAIAAIYALLPLYLQRTGRDISEVGTMMASVILGAMVLQYPVGRWSDRQDRRIVLITIGIACVLLSALVITLPQSSPFLIVVFFLLGGAIFAIYPVAVSFAADSTSADALVRMIQGLLLINSLGSAISPLIISPVMAVMGPVGLFWALSVLNILMVGFFIWRRGARPESTPTAPFAPATPYSPIGAELRVTDEMIQGAIENDNTDAIHVVLPEQETAKQ
ncbi:MFS transporter [Bacillus subtilis]|uniref:MFS transporter n=1 Tax=Pseudochrobactrum asaccharolyticum TaxID=354351 RepID=UPI001F2C879B|nr:MFS transporter [Pseudochrobactrum asaccharolyticum]MCF7645469.1 MFS transporter [Pseudochrobactrum asaccharolyticum]MCF7672081.1 MFS transporter [Bacillus subtilis]